MKFLDRLRQLRRGEEGIALPTAIFAMVASLGLAGAAVFSSVEVQQGAKRDSGSKSAIAAADAGVNVAVMRLNRDAAELEASPCLDGAAPQGDGWCPPVTGTVGGAQYSYRTSAAGATIAGCEFDLCVVATGSANGATRRVMVTFDAGPGGVTGGSEEEEEDGEETGGEETGGGGIEGLIGQDQIALSGNADIRVNIGTNGNLVSSGNASVCGNIRHGIGKTWQKSGNAHQCGGYEITAGNQSLPPVSSFMPADIATKNSNGRITACNKGLPVDCQLDTYNGSWSSTSPFDPKNRRISLSGNTVITLGGGDYWICQINLSGNSKLIMAAEARVRFFFDTPENCGVTTPINLSGNNEIAATGYKPASGNFDMPGFFVLGSPTIITSINLSGNYSTTNELVVYAPNTHINVSGNATFKGVVAGKTIAMSGNGKFLHDQGFVLPPSLNPWQGGSEEDGDGDEETEGDVVPPIFTPQTYVECGAASVALPSASC